MRVKADSVIKGALKNKLFSTKEKKNITKQPLTDKKILNIASTKYDNLTTE